MAYDISANARIAFAAMADINGDGKLDLVTGGADSVFVLFGNGDGSFGVSRSVAAVTAAKAVAIGDLNGDGRPDLAVACAGSFPDYNGTVSVLLGNGDGTFGPATNYAAGLGSSSVAIGDVSGDANPDLVVANTNSGTVSVLLATGGGTFAASTDFATGASPSSVVLADLNGDGKADAVVANSGSGTISVLMGNGDGTFAPKADFTTGTNPYSVAAADFNGDGRLDLVSANHPAAFPYPGSVSVLLGNGDGTFGPKSDVATGQDLKSIAVGDFDRDGALDVAIARDIDTNSGNGNGSAGLSLLFGNGEGGFRSNVEIPCGSAPAGVAGGDLNGDGRLDLVTVANYGEFRALASVLLGNGDGTFGGGRDYATGNSPLSIAIGDLNGDGKPDVLTANQGSTVISSPYGSYEYYTVSVLPGDGNGSYVAHTDEYVSEGTSLSFVTLDDFNGDGKLDAVVAWNAYNSAPFSARSFGGGVGILRSNGDCTFGPLQVVYSVGAGGWQSVYDLHADVSVIEGDLNDDHTPDLVVVYNLELSSLDGTQVWGKVWALLGHGDGTFAPADTSNMVFSAVGGSRGQHVFAALGEFNGDGRADLVVVNTSAGYGSVLLGNGNGTFGPANMISSGTQGWNDYGISQFPQARLPLAVSDLNGDGKQDLVIWHSVFLGNGDGTFAAEPDLDADPSALVIGDLDGDGIPDIAMGDRDIGMLVVQAGIGDGTFRQKQTFDVSAALLAMGDVNKDGRPDLVTSSGASTISVLLNTGAHLASAGPPLAPAAFRLLAPRPNPSRERVQIQFQLPRLEAAEAEIFDVAGRRTRTLLAKQLLPPGDHVLTWDGRDAAGAPARAGIYLIRVGAGSESHVGRVVLLGQ